VVCGRGIPAFRHLQSCVPGLRSEPQPTSACPRPHCHHCCPLECPVPPDKTQPCSSIHPVWAAGFIFPVLLLEI